jgi:HEPN domain-containing protein
MPNKNLAEQWLRKAFHNLTAAMVLQRNDHYTDVVAVEIHQAVEKTLKSLSAYNNCKIKKTHDLTELAALCSDSIELDEFELKILDIATDYYIGEKYPMQRDYLPPRDEINEVLGFAEKLFEKVCSMLEISVEGRSD